VQKERIKPRDMFILNEEGEILQRPVDPNLKCSECLSLFMVPFKLRDAGCCIHSHSINANLVTALYSEQHAEFRRKLKNFTPRDSEAHKNRQQDARAAGSSTEFRISNQEMIKGIRVGTSDKTFQYNDTLVVPIIDNVLHERDLAGAMFSAVSQYPTTNAVLVRNHGVYVWGKTWSQAKTMAECYDYLFKLKLEAAKCGLDWMLDE